MCVWLGGGGGGGGLCTEPLRRCIIDLKRLKHVDEGHVLTQARMHPHTERARPTRTHTHTHTHVQAHTHTPKPVSGTLLAASLHLMRPLELAISVQSEGE